MPKVLDVDGVQVVFKHKDSPITSIHFCVGVGACNENDSNRGISHFLEHSMFLGSDNISKADYWVEASKIGAKLNAHTSYDHTQYHLTVPGENFDRAFEILSDIFLHVKFPEEEFEKERTVVLDEIRRYDDDAWSYFCKYLYNKYLPYPILGDEDFIKNVSLDEMKAWRDKYYRGKNVIVTVVGNLNESQVTDAIRKYWKTFDRSGDVVLPYDKGYFNAGSDTFQKEAISQTYYTNAMTCLDKNSEDYATQKMVNGVLGGTMSSRLGKRVREELGLVYGIYSSVNSYGHFDILGVDTSSDAKNFPVIHDEVTAILEDLTKDTITQEELDIARVSILSTMDHNNETSSAINMGLSVDCLFGRPTYSDTIRDRIKAVTVEDCNRVAKDLFTRDRYVGYMENKE